MERQATKKGLAKEFALTRCIVLVGLVVSLGPSGLAQANFAAYQQYGAGIGPFGIVSADLNCDGLADLLTANEFGLQGGSYAGSISSWFSQGPAGFGGYREYRVAMVPSYTCTSWIVSRDFNGDSWPDVAIANYHDTIAVAYGQPGGTLGTMQFYSAPDGSQYITTADFDGDGLFDLACSGIYDDKVAVYHGQAGGGFGDRQDYAVGDYPHRILAADVNDDGYADIVTTERHSNTVTVLFGQSGGGFAPSQSTAAASTPTALAAADLNGDGFTDLVISNRSANLISVYYGDGDMALGLPTAYAVGREPFDIALADFNNDGWKDIACSNYAGDSVTVLYGQGEGGFGGRADFAAGDQPRGITAADFNGDGMPDLAVANYMENQITVLYNAIPEPAMLSLLGLGGLAVLRRRHGSR